MTFILPKDIVHQKNEVKKLIAENIIGKRLQNTRKVVRVENITLDDTQLDVENTTRKRLVFNRCIVTANIWVEAHGGETNGSVKVRSIKPIVFEFSEEDDLYNIVMEENAFMIIENF